MNTNIRNLTIVLGAGIITIFTGGCGDNERAFNPSGREDHRVRYISPDDLDAGSELSASRSLIIINPEPTKIREVTDPILSRVILATLPIEQLDLLSEKGIILIDDVEIAREIAILSGMSPDSVSDVIYVGADASWGCLKAQRCSPWPACCARDGGDDDKDQYFKVE